MPGLNKKGPNEEGPMTGRKIGHCNPDNKGRTDAEILQDKDSNLQAGCGFVRGQGLGGGHGLKHAPGLGRGQGGVGRGLGRQNRFRGGN